MSRKIIVLAAALGVSLFASGASAKSQAQIDASYRCGVNSVCYPTPCDAGDTQSDTSTKESHCVGAALKVTPTDPKSVSAKARFPGATVLPSTGASAGPAKASGPTKTN